MATVHQKNQAERSKAVPSGKKQGNNPIPKIRDTPDSRKNEEFLIKGDDVTHNTKKTKEEK